MTEETLAILTLNLIPGLGPVRIRRLMEVFSSASEVLRATRSTLIQVEGIGPQYCDAILSAEKTFDSEAEWGRAQTFGAKILSLVDSAYPDLLRQIATPPPILYVWGNFDLRDKQAIAIVGSRNPSSYGGECAKKLAYQLAYSGITVVSGLARGIDSFAHQGALAAKGRTLAVLGSGLCRIYPPENQCIAEKIALSAGAVISEFPMLTVASRQTFPARNRIISGLSLGVLVAEAGLKSGALITANAAIDQGRSIYAIPGRIDRPQNAGSNALIQQGAKLVSSAQDILDDFSLLFREPPVLAALPEPKDLSDEQKIIFFALGSETLHLDVLAAKVQLPVASVSSLLLQMELAGAVKQLPGKRFVQIL